MKKSNNIAFKALAVVGVFFLGKYLVDAIVNAAYNRITYSFGRPSVDFRGLANYPPVIKVILPMTIENKNPIGVTITSFVGEIFYGNIKLSDVIIPQGANVPANGQATLNLNLDIQGVQLINDVVNSMAQTGTYSTLINVLKLKGVLETSMYRVPIETNISLV
ncbi:hypothetical protein EBZ38_05470 [bacterium]|nr:hypothetical protein [bacterium]